MRPTNPPPSIFEIDSHLTLIPVVNASAPFASALRRELLKRPFDALAVPLPKSFANAVIEAVEQLPNLSMVALSFSDQNTTYSDSYAAPKADRSLPLATYVPIDPCQSVIAAIRFALGEHIPIAWVGSDSPPLRHNAPYFPDTYALRSTSLERFCAALLPSIRPPSSPSEQQRIEIGRAHV